MESSLSVDGDYLKSEVGSYLGFGRGTVYGDVAWSTTQEQEIDFIVKEGIRQVNNPPLVQGEVNTYDWSFLKAVHTIKLESGRRSAPLPDDFGGIEGSVYVSDSSETYYEPIQVGGVQGKFLQSSDATGKPQNAAVNWRKGTGHVGQRAELLIFPEADQEYTLTLQYYFLTDYISGASPYPYGGQLHASLYIASCLAVAEQRMNDRRGAQYIVFMERLVASISADRRSKPQVGGYNGDRSDEFYSDRLRRSQGLVTYVGRD